MAFPPRDQPVARVGRAPMTAGRDRPGPRERQSLAPRSATITVMIRAAFAAAKGLKRDFGEVEHLQVSAKGPADFVSRADIMAEKTLRAELSRTRPEYGFLGEEGGETKGDGRNRWIADPLDGTTNFLHGIPHWAISIGLERRMPDGSRAKMPFIDARAMAGATGVTSTVEDMAKFVSSQFQPRILSRGAQRQMHRVRLLENNWQSGYAVGFSVRRFQDRVYVGHGGSYPGYKTQTYIQLDDKVGVIVLTNGDDAEPGTIADQLLNTVAAAVARASSAPKPPLWDASWSRFAGLYRNGSGDTRVVEMNKELVTMTPHGPAASVQGRLRPLGDGTFRLEGPAGGAAVGEIVRFVEENGRVVRMVTGGGSYSRRVE